MNWEERLRAVGASEDAIQNIFTQHHDRDFALLSGATRASFEELASAIQDVLLLVRVYFRGVAYIKSLPEDGPIPGIDSSLTELVHNWVRAPEPGGACLSYALSAVFLTACLERYMAAMARVAASKQPQTESAQRAYEEHRKARTECGKAALSIERFIATRLQPTVEGRGEKWLRRVGEYTGAKIDRQVGESVVTMIEWRNAYVHSTMPASELVKPVDGGTVKAWALALRSFTIAVGAALS